jgi:hypothetical protein
MNDNAAVAGTSTDAALEALKRKQASRAKWSKIGGGLLALAILIRAGSALFGSHEALGCSDSEAVSTLTSAINDKEKAMNVAARVTSIDNIQQLSHDKSLSRCTARLAMTDQSTATINYHVDQKEVRMDSVE